MSEFLLHIRLGNQAMSKSSDVAAALRDVAEFLDRDWPLGDVPIRDHNGNTVGRYELSGDPPDLDEEGD